MLAVGSDLPQLDLEDSSGRVIELSDLMGRRGLIVYFMRTTTCPVCNHHVKDLVRRRDALETQGIGVVVAVPEGPDAAATWKARHQVPFAVVTGRHGTTHEAVGLNQKVFGLMQQSGTMVLSREGRVVLALAATLPTAGYDKRALDAAVGELRDGE